jgi:ArsR family transcriptional regulator
MEVISIYKCLCDEQRLRILNLLREGPLCVCHLMEILDSDQVKISKQLRYMKDLGMIECERAAQWMIYRLTKTKNPLLEENLKCLQDCAGEKLRFRADSRRRAKIIARLDSQSSACATAILPTL